MKTIRQCTIQRYEQQHKFRTVTIFKRKSPLISVSPHLLDGFCSNHSETHEMDLRRKIHFLFKS